MQEYGWERSSNRHSGGGRWTCKGENNVLCNVRAEGVSPDGLAREKTTFCDNVHEQKACCHLMTSTSAGHRHTETAVTQKLKLPNLLHRQKAQMAKPTLAPHHIIVVLARACHARADGGAVRGVRPAPLSTSQ